MERPTLNTFAAATESTASYNRSCTPAELEQLERMRTVRNIWEKDGNASSSDSNNANTPMNPTVNAAKFFQTTPTPFGNEFVSKAPGSNANGPSGNAVGDSTSNQNTWGGSYGSIWSFNS